MERIEINTSVDVQKTFRYEEIIMDEFIPNFLENPSAAMLQKAQRVVFGNLDTASERDKKRKALLQKYPELDWRSRVEGSQLCACWLELNAEQRRSVLFSTPQDSDKLRKFISPLLTSIGDDIESQETIELAAKVYGFLMGQNKVENMRDNANNNILLAQIAIQAAISRRMDFWRFVCMPEISMVKDGSKFVDWNCEIGSPRYDTLTSALDRDSEILAGLQQLGIKPQLYFVLDDWEVPWLRSEQDFRALSRSEQQKALEALSGIRQQTTNWINENAGKNSVANSGIIYFSSLIGYQRFVDLMDAPRLESESTYQGVFSEEKRFVIESARRVLTRQEADAKTGRRIIQYATEGSILANTFLTNGIYLNAEYPVQVVWKKLTLLADLPTLFYVTDKEVKNI